MGQEEVVGGIPGGGREVTADAGGPEVSERGPREGSLFGAAQGVDGRRRRLAGVGQPCQSLSLLSNLFHL